jgi:uroporphyrinogen decarboxylase
MTPRERFKAVIHFRKPDALPWLEMFYDETLLKWFREGLPADKITVIEWSLAFQGTVLANWPDVMGFDPYSHFGCQNLFSCLLPVDVSPIPRFKQRVIKETDRYLELFIESGAVARRLKKAEGTWYNMPMFVEFPVKDRESWEEYKKRLNPMDPRRYPKDWDKEVYMTVFEEYQGGPSTIRFTGFYGFGAQLMGIPAFNLMFYKDPELAHEMAEYWEYFTIEAIREAVEAMKNRIDAIYWWEDMADRHGPCLSPRLYREFLLPHYKKITSFLRKNKIDRIMMDSDGNMNPLLDLIVEAGITGLWPLEVNSNMNAITIKKGYGNKLFLMGNLDKRELAKGGIAMKKEVETKVPILKEMGGYIPGADHLIHTEFSFKTFIEYVDCIKKLLNY